ncbi:LysR family transcriptional regulator [Acidiphilium sp. AL]|uniref:LysR family transcriptional regulator n=1 Tax=Acidiphilium iwatense TaxID=768198 RepID=A0ABS9E053_9PROT|nr:MULTISPECIES: LysR family transcriptional regulator [Acidiphilium]MCF3947718.1 LysR family transcriptional regulator [Acidiphilium iwatense]MCU4160074.1 LysR family transcriptional regulator [Acidiphilium sp. AL]
MDIRQLRYFIGIVEAGSVSRAARLLHVAQPALSQHVLAIEADLGVTLLHRTARGVIPTEAGLRLLDHARAICAQVASLPDQVRGGAAIPSGEVRFGMPGTISEQLGVKLIEAAAHRYPKVRIRIVEAMSGYVLNWLRDGSVDLAMLYNVEDEKGLTLHHALTEDIQFFGIPTMKKLPRGESIGLGAALNLKLIVPGPAHGLRNLIDRAAKSIHKTLDPAIEIDSYRQIKQLAARGAGFGMLPTMAIEQELRSGTFRSWRVERPALMRRIHLGYQAGKPLSTASRAVGQLAWTSLEALVRNGGWRATWNDAEVLQLYNG